jgi:endonuclease/exonuclease/phosphatase family metal-dependent hydrolase
MKMHARVLAAVLLIFCAATGAARDVVFVHYNLANYLPMSRKVGDRLVADAPKPEKEVRAVIHVLKSLQPDILGVAEIGDRKMLIDFQSRLRKAGMDFPHLEWVAGEEGGQRHLALLSKFPIVARESLSDVPVEIDGRRHRMGRGILDVTVEITPSYRLRLVGLHLKSKRAVPMYDQQKFRAKEALIVRSRLEKILTSTPDLNLLLFGDLNDTKNEFPIREILGPSGSPASLRDLPVRDRYGLTWTHFWSAADVYSRIDYLMASKGLWPEIQLKRSGIASSKETRVASDHRPIYTTIDPDE